MMQRVISEIAETSVWVFAAVWRMRVCFSGAWFVVGDGMPYIHSEWTWNEGVTSRPKRQTEPIAAMEKRANHAKGGAGR